MNIDELKNTWSEDVSSEIPEISIENKNKINLPLERMRKNMRMEFFSTIGIFIFGFAIVWLCGAPFKFKFYLTILLASMVLVTFFFFSKFFRLYKDISDPVLKTYEGLKDLLYQFNLNKQYYLSFYLTFVPFLVCEIIIVIEFIPRPVPLGDSTIAIVLIGSVSFGLVLLYFLGNWWFSKLYGKYITRVENLIIEFKK
ncbi:hypothetical protein IQ37_16480 [Chryseobacterium piperi]|uniref:Uncharacterized protein n=1 Tax=Chryseobacterium piperi TaxID=558152 RepID=A0A086AQR5_9FLAO|nr:hypothetical protein [Chryseobacterium piperi]ASW73180.1 hypothetical protein CJF12_02000 [Chryseobacterium piperi]KFF19029.1 hypothetical protein IQ37_16480 [Chryseobacterium piperi]